MRKAVPPRTIDAFVLHPVYGVRNICAYNRMWLDHLSERYDSLIISYEDMHLDAPSCFRRLLDHFDDVTFTGEMLAETASIERMRAAQQTHHTGEAILRNMVSGKLRKAAVKGYLDELSPETVAQCQQIMAEYGFAD